MNGKLPVMLPLHANGAEWTDTKTAFCQDRAKPLHTRKQDE
jgi:hypothetical protein